MVTIVLNLTIIYTSFKVNTRSHKYMLGLPGLWEATKGTVGIAELWNQRKLCSACAYDIDSSIHPSMSENLITLDSPFMVMKSDEALYILSENQSKHFCLMMKARLPNVASLPLLHSVEEHYFKLNKYFENILGFPSAFCIVLW